MSEVLRVTKCEVCGESVEQTNKYRTKKTCSAECRYRLSSKSTRDSSGRWETKACIRCGSEFQNAKSKPKKYCTWDCMMEARRSDSRASRTCSVCGNEFTYFKRQDQRTCSPACRNKLTASRREVNFPECRVCGVSTGSYNRIYCDEHRPSRPGRKPMPRKVAVCLACGEEFSRPGSWPGKMIYCSNACSHRETKSVRDKFVANLNEKAVVFHSGYELRFWALCQRFDLPVRRYDGPDIKTPEGVYRPDFIVLTSLGEVIVEVKGYLRPESAVKVRSAREQGHKIVMVSKERLIELEQGDLLSVVNALLEGQQEALPGMP